MVEDNNLAHFYVYMCCVAAGLDVDRVCREMDVQALQQNISNVTFCDVASEASKPLLILWICGFMQELCLLQDFQGVDGNFIKLFRLAQLTIEYLLVSKAGKL